MHCGAEVTESSTNKQHHFSDLYKLLFVLYVYLYTSCKYIYIYHNVYIVDLLLRHLSDSCNALLLCVI